MLFDEFVRVNGQSNNVFPDPSLVVERGPDDVCVVDGLYPLPIEETSRLLTRSQSIPINYADGNVLADLLTCAGESFDVPRFSAAYLAAYLADIDHFQFGQPGTFSRDYVLIPTTRLEEYRRDYLDGSPIWGGFEHATIPPVIGMTGNHDPIRAVQGLKLPTDYHKEAAHRSLVQPYAFERFLKLYHLLELSFDRSIVTKIQNLGPDLNGIGQLLSSLESSELNRLKMMLGDARDARPIIDCLAALTSDPRWHPQIKAIFFDFGKSGNPLANKEAEFLSVISGGKYDASSIQPIANLPGPKAEMLVRQKAFETFSLHLAAYWIYRVRSSIAHSRIGEYLMSESDEPFVALFAEPLVRCVLAQVL